MARRKTRTVYRKAKRTYRRAASRGGFQPIIDGLIAGAGGKLASNYIGVWGVPAATLGVGYFMKNSTLKTIGGMQLGSMIGGLMPGIGGGVGGGSQV